MPVRAGWFVHVYTWMYSLGIFHCPTELIHDVHELWLSVQVRLQCLFGNNGAGWVLLESSTYRAFNRPAPCKPVRMHIYPNCFDLRKCVLPTLLAGLAALLVLVQFETVMSQPWLCCTALS